MTQNTRSTGVLLAIGAVAALAVGAYLIYTPSTQEAVPVTPAQLPQRAEAGQLPTLRFTDISAAAGIDFQHINGARGQRLLPETMGSGVAFLDYDRDGDQDLLLVNASYWPDDPAAAEAPTQRLYANDGKGAFTDVTAAAGLDISLYGMGVAVGDFDNDGWPDVFFTAVGENRLLHNQEGRFTDISVEAGVTGSDSAWSTAATWFDYDRDGDLDLYVGNYVQWSPQIDREVDFRLADVGRAYGPPTAFAGTQPYFYRNDGNGRFTEQAEAAGLYVHSPSGAPLAKALAALPFDVDADGWPDLLIANDTVRNLLFRNTGKGGFEEQGVELGLAFDRNGHATGAMGLDIGDFRNDGAPGLVIGNFANEMSSLYTSPGLGLPFSDDAIIEGLGAPSRAALSFATLFFDADLDGRLDLLQINGHIENEINRVQASQHYAQPAQLFWNCGEACPQRYQLLPEDKTGDLLKPMVGRGAAYADIDGDGDLDLALTEVGGPARLLRNDRENNNHWLRVRLQAAAGNRDGIGALVEIKVGNITQQRIMQPMRGYLSAAEPVSTFGLGAQEMVDQLTIIWPDGATEQMENITANQILTIHYPK